MQRVCIVATLLASVGCFACESKSKSGGSAGERVNAVPAAANQGAAPQEICDRYFEPGAGQVFRWPALAAGTSPALGQGWTWINVWATWCKPCVEELPRLRDWQRALSKEGLAVDLVLLSADEDDEIVATFAAKNKAALGSLRIADRDLWVESLVGKGASLPVHIFVDAAHRVRCVRASAVDDSELGSVRALLRAK